jgi:hypothetical protein
MTAPVVSHSTDMLFILPSKYSDVADTPQPTDSDVELVQLPVRTFAVQTFSGRTSMSDPALQSRRDDFVHTLRSQGIRCDALEWELHQFNPPCQFTCVCWFFVQRGHKGAHAKSVADIE